MGVQTRGEGAAKLARNIACVKYTLFCFNIVAWVSWYCIESKVNSQINLADWHERKFIRYCVFWAMVEKFIISFEGKNVLMSQWAGEASNCEMWDDVCVMIVTNPLFPVRRWKLIQYTIQVQTMLHCWAEIR